MKLSITTTRTGPSLTERVTVPVKCPKCGHESQHRLADLERNPLVVCSATGCGHEVEIEVRGDALNQVRDIDRLLDGFGKKR